MTSSLTHLERLEAPRSEFEPRLLSRSSALALLKTVRAVQQRVALRNDGAVVIEA